MSRTRKGTKQCGHEYNSKRPDKSGGIVGSYTKMYTHRAERRNARKMISAYLCSA